jgi:peroxiredoxin
MRKLLLLISSALVIGACNQGSEGFRVTVELDGTEGQWITLQERVDRNNITVDSALAEAGVPLVLEGSVDGIQSMYLGIKDQRNKLQLLLENADYSVSGSMEDPVITTEARAQSDMNAYNEEISEIQELMQNRLDAYYAAAESGDGAAKEEALKAYYAVNEEKTAFDSLYILQHPASAVSVIQLRNSFYGYETGDLEKVLLSLDESLHGMREYVYMFGKMERQKAVAIGNNYSDFGLPTPEGEVLKISDIHEGQVLLIDFWASWCGPCRRANPEVVAVFQKYHDQGFDVIGVSLDEDREAWLKAVEDDKLTWHHVSDLKGWYSAGAELYGVPAIPHTVLVDRKGVIRHKNLHGEELEQAIAALL